MVEAEDGPTEKPMPRTLFSPTAVLLALLVLTGCAAMTLQPPSVTLAHLEVIEAGLFEQRFAFKLRLLNPNNRELDIAGLTFEVELNGQPFAKGVSNKPVKVPRLGEALLEVTAVSGLAGILRQLNEAAQGSRRAMTYRIKGRLLTDPYGSLPFDESGTLDLPRLSPPQ
jgi:LEA14-like dessication related protein